VDHKTRSYPYRHLGIWYDATFVNEMHSYICNLLCPNILHIPHEQTKPTECSDHNMVLMYSFMA